MENKNASSGNRTQDICLEGRYFTTKLMMLFASSIQMRAFPRFMNSVLYIFLTPKDHNNVLRSQKTRICAKNLRRKDTFISEPTVQFGSQPTLYSISTCYCVTMPPSWKHIVDCVPVGEPPKNILGGVETVKFIIYNFKDRGKENGHHIESSISGRAHGYEWGILVFPRASFNTPQEYISLYLELRQHADATDQVDVTALSSFRCKSYEKNSLLKHSIQYQVHGAFKNLLSDRVSSKTTWKKTVVW